MRALVARGARWLANACTRAAEQLDAAPSADGTSDARPLERSATAPSDDPEGDAAMRAIGVRQLREALRRYSPDEERAQA